MESQVVRKKVFVGMSGGVDSSVSATLLKKAGYDVTGVFIKVWQPDFVVVEGCNWKDDMRDAMRICAKLDIPFVKLDLEKEYKKEVVDYMIREYKMGRTPNPDVMCNKHVKFGAFFDWAMGRGADYVATGHYAQILEKKKGKMGKFELRVSVDKEKDQTYFLYNLTQRELSKTLFPIGHLRKSEVRKLACKFGLVTAGKKDSQGLCFIGKVDMKEFLKNFIKSKKGKVLNVEGNIIGEHDGAVFYTTGERHGFIVSDKTVRGKPLYVIGKDLKKNTIMVSEKSGVANRVKNARRIVIKNVNWSDDTDPSFSKKYSARIRYRQPLSNCRLVHRAGEIEVVFVESQEAVTVGQSLVLYEGEKCIGGGVIDSMLQ